MMSTKGQIKYKDAKILCPHGDLSSQIRESNFVDFLSKSCLEMFTNLIFFHSKKKKKKQENIDLQHKTPKEEFVSTCSVRFHGN